MASAVGRCDIEPAAYRTASPIARPSRSVMSSESTVVRTTARLAMAYTPKASHSAFRHRGHALRSMIVA